MKITGLDGRLYNLNLSKSRANTKCSSLHQEALDIVREFFPNYTIYQEIQLPGSKSFIGRDLYADIMIPQLRLIFEPSGQQHYEYSSFFHRDKLAFYRGQDRDKNKEKWCQTNNFTYIELPYNERDGWKEIIVGRISD